MPVWLLWVLGLGLAGAATAAFAASGAAQEQDKPARQELGLSGRDGVAFIDQSSGKTSAFTVPTPPSGKFILELELELRTRTSMFRDGQTWEPPRQMDCDGEIEREVTGGRPFPGLGETVRAQLRFSPDNPGPTLDVEPGDVTMLLNVTTQGVDGGVKVRVHGGFVAVYCRNFRNTNDIEDCGETSYRVGRIARPGEFGDDVWLEGSPRWLGEVRWRLVPA